MTENSNTVRRQILSSLQTSQKIRRIAFEIYEQNFEESSLLIAGIEGEGYAFAGKLANELRDILRLRYSLSSCVSTRTFITKVQFYLMT